MTIALQPIGVIHSCFKEKFGIPRQSGLAPAAPARLELLPPYDREEALRGLEGFSHIWVLFLFHQSLRAAWKPTVRPPRLGGNRRVGVFATRSTFRPNPLGMSAVELRAITRSEGRLCLHLQGVDLLDGTPVVDIKPYLPYTDSIPSARGGFASGAPAPRQQVRFSSAAKTYLRGLDDGAADDLRCLIMQVLAQDPRPAYLAGDHRRTSFGMHLGDVNLRWKVEGRRSCVISIQAIDRGTMHGN